MFMVTEQHALELRKRCEAIKEISDPAIFAQIEALVQQAVTVGQLSDSNINKLYELLYFVVIANYSDLNDESEIQFKQESKTQEKQIDYEQRIRDIRNHLLLCNRANIRTLDALRNCLKLIANPKKRLSFSQEQHF